MKKRLALCKLIPSEKLDDEDTLIVYSRCLLKDAVTKVLPVQPIAMRRMEEFIVKCRRLFDSVLLDNAIPINELPPCILTEMLNKTDAKLKEEWNDRTNTQLTAMYNVLPEETNITIREDVLAATKASPIRWNPLNVMSRSED